MLPLYSKHIVLGSNKRFLSVCLSVCLNVNVNFSTLGFILHFNVKLFSELNIILCYIIMLKVCYVHDAHLVIFQPWQPSSSKIGSA